MLPRAKAGWPPGPTPLAALPQSPAGPWPPPGAALPAPFCCQTCRYSDDRVCGSRQGDKQGSGQRGEAQTRLPLTAPGLCTYPFQRLLALDGPQAQHLPPNQLRQHQHPPVSRTGNLRHLDPLPPHTCPLQCACLRSLLIACLDSYDSLFWCLLLSPEWPSCSQTPHAPPKLDLLFPSLPQASHSTHKTSPQLQLSNSFPVIKNPSQMPPPCNMFPESLRERWSCPLQPLEPGTNLHCNSICLTACFLNQDATSWRKGWFGTDFYLLRT